MKKEIKKLADKYSQYITDEIRNQNTGGALIKFNRLKSDFLNSEFEGEKEECINKIKKGIVYFKNRVLRCSDDSKRNDTYILKNNEGYFLEYLHYYLEYRKLLNVKIKKENNVIIKQSLHGHLESWDNDLYVGHTEEPNLLIKKALKKDKKEFNVSRGNHRWHRTPNAYIGQIEVYTILGKEYFIEYCIDNDGDIRYRIVNFEYGSKWYENLNNIYANNSEKVINPCMEFVKNIKDNLLEKAEKRNITNFNTIASAVQSIFNVSVFYHTSLDNKIDYSKDNYGNDILESMLTDGKVRFERCENNYFEHQNTIFGELSDLYTVLSPFEIQQLREFIIRSILDIKHSMGELYFQWGYSPFSTKIDEICSKLNEIYSDKKLKNKAKLMSNLSDTKEPQQTTKLKQEAKKPKPKFNPSQFNEYTHNLFTYILENYTTKGIVKYINIWYFLKKDIKDKADILFNFTQKEYKRFIKKEYGIEIKKFQKAEYKYPDNELGILQNIFKTYCDNFNKIDTT